MHQPTPTMQYREIHRHTLDSILRTMPATTGAHDATITLKTPPRHAPSICIRLGTTTMTRGQLTKHFLAAAEEVAGPELVADIRHDVIALGAIGTSPITWRELWLRYTAFVRIPADQISALTPSQILDDARQAGARPDDALDAVAHAIAAVMEPVTGSDFHYLLPGLANDVRDYAHGWLFVNHGLNPRIQPIDYAELSDDQVAGMLDHVAGLACKYDQYAG